MNEEHRKLIATAVRDCITAGQYCYLNTPGQRTRIVGARVRANRLYVQTLTFADTNLWTGIPSGATLTTWAGLPQEHTWRVGK